MDLVMSTSTDGIAWTAPQRIPTTDPAAQTHSLVPGLGVDHATSGRTTRLAVVYYTMARSCEAGACPGLGVSIVTSGDGGRTWGAPERLNAVPMRLDWISETGLGRMLADYLSVSFVNGRAIPVFALAAEVELGQFRQAIFARVPPARS